MQLGGNSLRLDDIGFVTIDQRGSEFVGELAHAMPQLLLDAVRRPGGIGDVGCAEQLLESVGIEWVALQTITGQEERGQRFERQLVGVVVVAVSSQVDAFVVLDVVEDGIDQFLVGGTHQ